jgi:hypothetical protein
MLWLELFGQINRVIDASKASRAATAEVATEIVGNNVISRNIVHFSQTLANLILRNRRAIWMQNLDNLKVNLNKIQI